MNIEREEKVAKLHLLLEMPLNEEEKAIYQKHIDQAQEKVADFLSSFPEGEKVSISDVTESATFLLDASNNAFDEIIRLRELNKGVLEGK